MQADGPQQAESSRQGAARPMSPMAPSVVLSSRRVASELSLEILPSSQQEEPAALKRGDTEVVPDVPLPPQQSPELLAQHSIRVRDFAYECILSPLPSVRRFRQLPPASRPFKRTKRSHGNSDDLFFGGGLNMSPIEGMLFPSESSSQEDEDQRGRPLQRKATEPVIPMEGPTTGPSRTGAYMDVTEYEPPPSQSQPQTSNCMPPHSPAERPSLSLSSQSPLTPPALFVGGHAQESLLLATSLQPSESGQLEDTDTQVATPLVTPHGSFQWETNSPRVVPPSALQPSSMEDVTRSPPSSFVWQPTPAQTIPARVSTPLLPSKSSCIRPNGSISQLSPMSSLTSLPMSPALENAPLPNQPPTPSLSPRSRGAHLLRTDHSQSLLSSMSSLTSLRSSPPPATSPLSAGPSPIASPAPEPEPRTSPPPRYFLRARSNSGRRNGAPSPTPKSRSTRGALPYPRYSAVTRQSAHSRSPKSSDSPRAKPLKRAVA